tara:strand:- start:197 stop:892 length:696 start_codon:yes stop_codon:yes gene_type:complete
MNRNNYISPRSYGNEATLFINPAKTDLTKDKKQRQKPSLILSFFIVILIFSSIIGYSAYADTSDKQNNEWFVEKSVTAPIIYIAGLGEIQDDYLTFMLDSDNCSEVGLTFQMTSIMESMPLVDLAFQVRIIEHPGNEYITEASVVGNIVEEDYIISQLMFHNLVTTQDLEEMLGNKDKFEIQIILPGESGLADPSLFFDISYNIWDLENLFSALREAQFKCRHKIFDIIEV